MNLHFVGRTILVLYLSIGIGADLASAESDTDDEAFETAKALLGAAYEAEDATAAAHLGESSLAKLEEAKDATRKQAEFFVFKGFVLDFLDQPHEALAAFAEAEKLDPEDARPLHMQGEIHLDQQRPEAALAFFESFVELRPQDAGAVSLLAYTLMQLQRWEEAEASLRAALDLDAEQVQAKRDLGAVLAALGRHEEAVPIWKSFVEADAEDIEAHWNLAQTRQLMGELENAEREFLAYREKDPGYWRTLEKLCQLAEAMEKPARRDRWIADLYALYSTDNAPPDLVEQGFFIRDQFVVDDLKGYGLEYFELKGERALKYSFRIYREPIGEEREFINKVSLGSYESTNRIAHELGATKDGERRYHLDMYPPDGSHATLGFFNGNPGYEVAKKMAIEAFRGELEPLSQSFPARPDSEDGEPAEPQEKPESASGEKAAKP